MINQDLKPLINSCECVVPSRITIDGFLSMLHLLRNLGQLICQNLPNVDLNTTIMLIYQRLCHESLIGNVTLAFFVASFINCFIIIYFTNNGGNFNLENQLSIGQNFGYHRHIGYIVYLR